MANITTEQYLAVSALAYSDLSRFIGKNLNQVIAEADKNEEIIEGYKNEKTGSISPEFHALSSLSNWTLIAQSPILTANVFTQNGYTRKLVAGNDFSAIALKNPETGEIVFAFRGTNNMGDWDTDVAIAGGVHHLLVDQFARAKSFVFDVMNKFGPICYENQEQMFKDIGERGGVSFTGHSLGGGLAQYIYYRVRYLFYKHPAYGML